jgi:hypothetical protein
MSSIGGFSDQTNYGTSGQQRESMHQRLGRGVGRYNVVSGSAVPGLGTGVSREKDFLKVNREHLQLRPTQVLPIILPFKHLSDNIKE